jgi:hypothetical protein
MADPLRAVGGACSFGSYDDASQLGPLDPRRAFLLGGAEIAARPTKSQAFAPTERESLTHS